MRNLAEITASLPASLHPFVRSYLGYPSKDVNVSSIRKDVLRDMYYNRLTSMYDANKLNENVVQAKSVIAKGIEDGIRHAVFRSSVDQALRGNVSFGVLNSLQYLTKKVKKFLK